MNRTGEGAGWIDRQSANNNRSSRRRGGRGGGWTEGRVPKGYLRLEPVFKIRLKDFRNSHGSVFLLICFQDSQQCPAHSQAGAV